MQHRARLVPLLVLLLITAAHSASAQRGMGGGGGGGRGGRGMEGGRRDGASADIPPASDIDKLDPIAMLVGNQKDLGLTPEQVGALSGLDSQLMQGTKPSLAKVDSLRASFKEASESPDARGATRGIMNAYRNVVGDIRGQIDEASKKALDLLSGEARSKAEKLLQSRREEFDKVTKTKA